MGQYNSIHAGATIDSVISNAPTKTGGGASGTWAIDISGNAATATNAANASLADYATIAYDLQQPGTWASSMETSNITMTTAAAQYNRDISITSTNGRPIFISCNANINPTSAASTWCYLRLYKFVTSTSNTSTLLRIQTAQTDGNNSHNLPIVINCLDTNITVGTTYIYRLNIYAGAVPFELGETAPGTISPYIFAFEI